MVSPSPIKSVSKPELQLMDGDESETELDMIKKFKEREEALQHELL